MSTKEQYLKHCVNTLSPLENKRWYIGLLSILLPSAALPMDRHQVVCRPQGLFYTDVVDGVSVEIAIVDAQLGTPLYKVTDRITIDASWLPNVQGQIETTVGRLLLNAAAIYPALGTKIAYINKPLKVKSLEADISDKIKDDADITDSDKDIRVSEYLDCIDRVWFFTKLANLITVASTPKTVLPPPGIDALRQKLLKDNAGKLSDPVALATMIDALAQHDAAYLSDDPSAKHILDRKGNTARKKLFHMYGETNDFNGSLASDPITGTMQQGVDTSEAILPKYMNDLRYASYSRGHSTQLSGYSYKILQRSLSGLEIAQESCNTQRGMQRRITQPDKLLNRYVREKNQWTLVANRTQAGTYLGKVVQVKSPMYCTTPGNAVCYSCLGENFKGNKNAINNIAAGFSGELMTLFLKRMHTSGFTLTDIHLDDLVT